MWAWARAIDDRTLRVDVELSRGGRARSDIAGGHRKKHPRDDGDRVGAPEFGGAPGLTYLSKGSKAGKVKARRRWKELNIVQTKYFLDSEIGEAQAFVGGA